MFVNEFIEQVRKTDDIKIEAVNISNKSIITTNKYNYKVEFSISSINDFSWEILADVARGIKSSNPLHHLSRVVGYYSRIENWNESKVAERKARRAGNYSVSETTEEPIKVECTNGYCKAAV